MPDLSWDGISKFNFFDWEAALPAAPQPPKKVLKFEEFAPDEVRDLWGEFAAYDDANREAEQRSSTHEDC